MEKHNLMPWETLLCWYILDSWTFEGWPALRFASKFLTVLLHTTGKFWAIIWKNVFHDQFSSIITVFGCFIFISVNTKLCCTAFDLLIFFKSKFEQLIQKKWKMTPPLKNMKIRLWVPNFVNFLSSRKKIMRVLRFSDQN